MRSARKFKAKHQQSKPRGQCFWAARSESSPKAAISQSIRTCCASLYINETQQKEASGGLHVLTHENIQRFMMLFALLCAALCSQLWRRQHMRKHARRTFFQSWCPTLGFEPFL